jgi:hypothetical protein
VEDVRDPCIARLAGSCIAWLEQTRIVRRETSCSVWLEQARIARREGSCSARLGRTRIVLIGAACVLVLLHACIVPGWPRLDGLARVEKAPALLTGLTAKLQIAAPREPVLGAPGIGQLGDLDLTRLARGVARRDQRLRRRAGAEQRQRGRAA